MARITIVEAAKQGFKSRSQINKDDGARPAVSHRCRAQQERRANYRHVDGGLPQRSACLSAR